MFREKGREGGREGERSINMWRPLLETWPTAQACALIGNRTGNLFGLQVLTQSTELHQPGPRHFLMVSSVCQVASDL